jgi:prevent-host-death family protein
MTMQFNIGEAKDRLSQLVAAARRGEDIVIALAGQPQVKLVPVEGIQELEREAEIARRMSAFGMFQDTCNAEAIKRATAPMSDEELEDLYGSKWSS